MFDHRQIDNLAANAGATVSLVDLLVEEDTEGDVLKREVIR